MSELQFKRLMERTLRLLPRTVGEAQLEMIRGQLKEENSAVRILWEAATSACLGEFVHVRERPREAGEMRDHHPALSGKELRLLLDEFEDRRLACLRAFASAEYELEEVLSELDRINETMLARRRANMLAETRAARKKGEGAQP
jgi:hypothetical protein